LITASELRMKHAFAQQTRDEATYNNPCAHEGLEKKIPTQSSVWPWLLWTVMAKHGINGNCTLLRVKGIAGALVVKIILGKQTNYAR
jgi:hypothetical protein